MSEQDMQDPKQEEEPTSNQPDPTDGKQTEDSTLGEDESKTTTEPSTDYKAQLDLERARLKKAEDKIVKLKREKKEEPVEAPELVQEEQQVDDSDLETLIQEKVAQLEEKMRGELVSGEVEAALKEVSTDSTEQELIRLIYENRLKKTGYSRVAIMDDLVNAKIIANREAVLRQNQELRESLKSKLTLNSSANYSNATRRSKGKEPQINDKERKLLERFGAMERFKKQS
jgi:hypothetical protein